MIEYSNISILKISVLYKYKLILKVEFMSHKCSLTKDMNI